MENGLLYIYIYIYIIHVAYLPFIPIFYIVILYYPNFCFVFNVWCKGAKFAQNNWKCQLYLWKNHTGLATMPSLPIYHVWPNCTHLDIEKRKPCAATTCNCWKECNKLDLTTDGSFWSTHRNDWSRWVAPPYLFAVPVSVLCVGLQNSK
jgi:hypothetical protein